MDKEQIAVSLVHIRDRNIQKGVIELVGSYPNFDLIFTSAIVEDIKVQGHDYFKCLLNLRLELENKNYYLLCNGARKNIICGGMLREYSNGRSAYIITLGNFADPDNTVDIFEHTQSDLVVSVKEQEEYNKLYRSSLPDYPIEDK